MRWTPGGRSPDLEDRRGQSAGFGGFGGGMGRAVPLGIGGVVVLFVLSLLTGQDFLSLLSGGDATVDQPGASAPVQTSPAEEEMVQKVSWILDDSQATWDRVLP